MPVPRPARTQATISFTIGPIGFKSRGFASRDTIIVTTILPSTPSLLLPYHVLCAHSATWSSFDLLHCRRSVSQVLEDRGLENLIPDWVAQEDRSALIFSGRMSILDFMVSRRRCCGARRTARSFHHAVPRLQRRRATAPRRDLKILDLLAASTPRPVASCAAVDLPASARPTGLATQGLNGDTRPPDLAQRRSRAVTVGIAGDKIGPSPSQMFTATSAFSAS